MLDSETINKFLAPEHGVVSDVVITNKTYTLTRAGEYELIKGKNLEEFTRQDFIDMFNHYKWTLYGSTVRVNKAILVSYLEWQVAYNGLRFFDEANGLNALKSVNKSDLDAGEMLSLYYFASEEDFINCINGLFNGDEFIRAKVAVILYWAGLNQKQAALVRKDEISEQLHYLGRPLIKIMQEHAIQDSLLYTDTRGVNRTYYLSNSDYLLRASDALASTGKGSVNTPLAKPMLDKFIVTANRVAKEAGSPKRFKQSALSQNGLYCRIFEYEKSCGAFASNATTEYSLPILKTLGMEVSSSVARTIFNKYLCWREYFHQI